MTFVDYTTNRDSSVSGNYVSRYFFKSLQFASTDYFHIIENVGPFRMRKPLYFEVSKVEDGIVLSNDEADLHAAGAHMSEAEADLLDELHLVWNEYACCDDSELDEVAKQYKKWLLDNIEGPVE